METTQETADRTQDLSYPTVRGTLTRYDNGTTQVVMFPNLKEASKWFLEHFGEGMISLECFKL